VAGKVRFRKQEHSGHAARMREFVPYTIANNAQFEITYDLFADAADRRFVSKQGCRAAFCVNQPFSAYVHNSCRRSHLLLPVAKH